MVFRQMSRFAKGLALCLIVLVGAAPASADMKAFNKAVEAGDYKAAAAEARGVWASYDRTRPSTAVVAREFGFISYLAEDYAAARDYGAFLLVNGASLPKPDDQPATSIVLLRLAEYRLDPVSGRDGLVAALNTRAGVEGIETITVLAAEALYKDDLSGSRLKQAEASAALAASLLKRGGDDLLVQAYNADIARVAASFLSVPRPEGYYAMADVHDNIVADIDRLPILQRRFELGNLKFQAEAWTMTLQAVLRPDRIDTGTRLQQQLKPRRLASPQVEYFPKKASADPRPPCNSELQANTVDYPPSEEFSGGVGAVIMSFDYDEQGAVVGSRVLASVPQMKFAGAVTAASRSFRFKPTRNAVSASCRLSGEGKIASFVFAIP